jgi:endonuclease/exonuclease/phosphatase (EEP) superfamily protein YafD
MQLEPPHEGPPGQTPRRVAAGRIFGAMVGVVAAAVLVLTVTAPQATGILALAQILLPHLVLATLLAASLVAVALRTRAVTVALVALVVVAFLRFGSEWISLPVPAPAGMSIRLASWNLQLGARPASEVADPLLEHDADVVALEELTPDAASALDHDAGITARYPFRFLVPDPGTFGIGILSAYPITERTAFSTPAGVVVTLDLGSGRHVRVLAAHPPAGQVEVLGRYEIPVGFDGTERDADNARVRARIDRLLTGAGPLLVLGDYNTAPTEPGYDKLTKGLRDVHVEVGLGPGWTWRPRRLEFLGIGLLRIDLILVGPGVSPLSSGVDCAHIGDHCIVDASVAIP